MKLITNIQIISQRDNRNTHRKEGISYDKQYT